VSIVLIYYAAATASVTAVATTVAAGRAYLMCGLGPSKSFPFPLIERTKRQVEAKERER